jgi:hypothetical protein
MTCGFIFPGRKDAIFKIAISSWFSIFFRLRIKSDCWQIAEFFWLLLQSAMHPQNFNLPLDNQAGRR